MGVVGCVCWPALEIVLCCHLNMLIKRLLAQQMPFRLPKRETEREIFIIIIIFLIKRLTKF